MGSNATEQEITRPMAAREVTMKIQLSAAELSRISRPVRGQGGFQSLLRKLQKQLDGALLEVSEADLERLVRYSFEYGQGGFQERTKATARLSR